MGVLESARRSRGREYLSRGEPARCRLEKVTMTVMAFTVVPLHNVSLPVGTRVPFGDDLVFQDTPEWV